jgi:hypothetical protein
MDDTLRKEVDPGEESSREYRLRFRYELWSQASQDFRSPAVCKRFPSIVVDATASGLNSGTGEPDSGSGSDGAAERRNLR